MYAAQTPCISATFPEDVRATKTHCRQCPLVNLRLHQPAIAGSMYIEQAFLVFVFILTSLPSTPRASRNRGPVSSPWTYPSSCSMPSTL